MPDLMLIISSFYGAYVYECNPYVSVQQMLWLWVDGCSACTIYIWLLSLAIIMFESGAHAGTAAGSPSSTPPPDQLSGGRLLLLLQTKPVSRRYRSAVVPAGLATRRPSQHERKSECRWMAPRKMGPVRHRQHAAAATPRQWPARSEA